MEKVAELLIIQNILVLCTIIVPTRDSLVATHDLSSSSISPELRRHSTGSMITGLVPGITFSYEILVNSFENGTQKKSITLATALDPENI